MINIEKFAKWADEGQREVRIVLDNQMDSKNGHVISIWCYDYKLTTGKHVSIHDDPPTSAELKADLKYDLHQKLEALD